MLVTPHCSGGTLRRRTPSLRKYQEILTVLLSQNAGWELHTAGYLSHGIGVDSFDCRLAKDLHLILLSIIIPLLPFISTSPTAFTCQLSRMSRRGKGRGFRGGIPSIDRNAPQPELDGDLDEDDKKDLTKPTPLFAVCIGIAGV